MVLIAEENKAQVKNHLPWLDWLRFLAAFAVLLGHTRSFVFAPYGNLDGDSQGILTAVAFLTMRFGHHAVLFFFVISGFLVGGRMLERLRLGSFDEKSYVDRATRIMVPLVPVLCATALVQVLIGNSIDWISFLGNLFSLQRVLVSSFGDNLPLWSLAYEVWFYILALGFAFVFTGRRPLIGTIIFILVFLVFTRLDAIYLFSWCIGAAVYSTRKTRFSLSGFVFSCATCSYFAFSIMLSSASVSFPGSLLFLKDYILP